MINKEDTIYKFGFFSKKLKKYWVLIVLIIGVPALLLFGHFYIKFSFKTLDYLQRENSKYSLVQNIDSVTGVVDSIYSDRGGSFVKLTDSNKIWFEVSENKMYDKYLLCDFLRQNDSIVKRKNNDTLFIYRQKKIYFFKLGQLNNK
jgi:hypothetical protein